nr:MAG TPA: hypothetical protein [Caudoviricetes sp.]
MATLKLIGKVLTNCEEDSFGRVKVSIPNVFEFSPLLPSLNSIYLEVGDSVLVDLSLGPDNAFILGKVYDYNQAQSSPKGDYFTIYEAKSGSEWSRLGVSGTKLVWENSSGVQLHVDGTKISLTPFDSLSVEGQDISVICDSATVSAKSVDLSTDQMTHSGSQLNHNIPTTQKPSFSSTPTATGGYCALRTCLYTGSPHTGNSIK